MPTLAEIRAQYPQYGDLSDDQLADGLYKKFYSDMPRETFNRKIGMLGGVDAKPPGAGGQEPPPGLIERGIGALQRAPAAFERFLETGTERMRERQKRMHEEFERGEKEGPKGIFREMTEPGSATRKAGIEAGTSLFAPGAAARDLAAARAATRGTVKGPGYIEKLREETGARAGQEAATEAATVERELVPQLPPELQAMRAVAEKNSERIARTQDLRNLGFRPDEAKRMVAQAERRVQETEQAVTVLEQHLLQMPQTTPEQFGLQLRGAAKQIYDNAAKVRENQAGFGKALQAGDERNIRVPVKPAVQAIDEEMAKTVNPGTRYVLEQAKNALQLQGGDSLTLRAADSGRKWLQQAIQTRRVADRAIDKEASHALQKVAGNLIEAAQRASPEYKEALTRYRIFSRPLDVVERKGALRKVLDKDPMTTDYLLSEAKVVGEVIKKAQAGNPVFSRLLEQSPELKDSARLYFTHDLFGKEAVPSPDRVRSWLRTNERPLKQLGLYDEFRDLRLARETAQKAVQGAKEGKVVAEKLATRAESAQRLQVFTSSINSAAPEKVPGMARSFLTQLGNEGKMTPQQLQGKLTEITRIEERYTNQRERITRIRKIAAAAAAASLAGGFGYGGYHVARRAFGD